MKQLAVYFSAILLLVAIGACTQENLINRLDDDTSVAGVRRLPRSISVREAENRMRSFMGRVNSSRTRTSSDVDSVFPVTLGMIRPDVSDSAYTNEDPGLLVNDPMLDTLVCYYVFNFSDNGGFVISSAIEGLPPVIAFSDRGHLTERNMTIGGGSDKPLISSGDLFIYVLCEMYSWAGMSPGEGFPGGGGAGSASVPDPDSTTYEFYIRPDSVPAMCTTKWTEGAPMNQYCPEIGGKRAKAGSMAVALAQLMAYHNYPAWHNNLEIPWGAMRNWDNGVTNYGLMNIASLLRNLGSAPNLNNTYGLTITNSEDGAAIRTLRNYGYTSDIKDSPCDSTIVTELQGARPVVIYGRDVNSITRAALAHGLMRYYFKEFEWFKGTPKVIDDGILNYVLLDMGNGGKRNGYYLLNLFGVKIDGENPNISYTYLDSRGMRIIHNIHP